MNDEKIYNELKCLNVSQARGEEELKGIRSEFKTLNGSVKKHAKKIYWIEKVLWMTLGVLGLFKFLMG